MEQRFDGQEVAVFEGRFTGTFDIPHDVGAGMGIFDDEEYVFTVVVTPKSASFGETKTGDPKRTNTLKVVEVQYEGHRSPVTISVEEPEVGIDSPAGQLTVDDALTEEEAPVEEAGVPEEEIFTPPAREPEPIPVGVGSGASLRDRSGDDVLKRFLDS